MAIVIERTITVKNDKATLDNPLYLYVGDGDIVCLFTIKEIKKAATFGAISQTNLITESASYGEIRIYKPTDELAFTTRAEIIDDKLQALFSYEHIDQLTESGTHQLQIHLYDDESEERNRFTIPPVDISVLLPIGSTISSADYAAVDHARVKEPEEPIDTFLEDGSYNKTEWKSGDKITTGKLNKIEDAIYQINADNGAYITGDELEAKGYLVTVPDEYITEGELDAKGYLTEHQSLNNYATKQYVNDAIDNADIDLTNYATKNEIPTKTSQLTNDSYFVTQSLLSSKGYVTNTALDAKGYITNTQLDAKKYISSMAITRIEVVVALPEVEEDGVLYIVKE